MDFARETVFDQLRRRRPITRQNQVQRFVARFEVNGRAKTSYINGYDAGHAYKIWRSINPRAKLLFLNTLHGSFPAAKRLGFTGEIIGCVEPEGVKPVI